ncbi:MAG: hypothetical protein PSV24_01400 [Rhodoferax sp.]|nr:hypothetical protein [Rhodoferax sp.]
MRDMGLPEYSPFAVSEVMATDLARQAARHFWASLAAHPLVSEPLRQVADTMAA